NNDGHKVGEAGIGGTTLTLTGTSDLGPISPQTATTAPDGSYSFTGLRPGSYTVTEGTVSGYLDGLDALVDVVIAGSATTDLISSIAVAQAANTPDNNFGEVAPGSISGFVYYDSNNNGKQSDDTTHGIGGVPMALGGTDDLGATVTGTTTTAPDGSYSFGNLRPGTYTVTEGTITGFLDGLDALVDVVIAGSVGTDLVSGIGVAQAANTPNNNFGEILAGSLSGFVYADANNDGHKVGEAGIGGITLTLSGSNDLGPITAQVTTTAPDGSYSFTGLRPGSYTVTEGTVSGYLDGQDALGDVVIAGSASTDLVAGIVVLQNADSANNNFGEILAGSLSGFVYADANNDGHKVGESGIGGTTLTLTGTSDLGPIAAQTATTGPDGSYSFGNLRPGTYIVTEGSVTGYLDGQDALVDIVIAGSATTDVVAGIGVVQNANTPNNNFGEVKAGSLSGFVYADANNDGHKVGEAGIGGITLTLSGSNDLGPITSQVTTTAPDGSYSFGNLRPGSYNVTEGTVAGYLDGLDAKNDVVIAGSATTDLVAGIAVVQNANSANNNFGEVKAGSLSGFVYADANNDGHKVGESGIGGITLTLSGTSDLGTIAAQTATTAADGSYSFTGLRPGSYTVTEGAVSGYLDGLDAKNDVVIAGSTTTDLVAGIAVVQNADSANNNFGEVKAGSLSGFVYVDADNDGVKDSGEVGINAVKVTLSGTNDQGKVSIDATTDGSGYYNFGNLRPGTYTITETQPANYADGMDKIGTPGGTSGNDVFSSINLNAGVNGANNNFGELPPITISGTTFLDTTGNGLSSDDLALGKANNNPVVVNLYLDKNNNGVIDTGDTLAGTQNVDVSTGAFSFTKLAPGTYIVQEVVPAGYILTGPTNAPNTYVVQAVLGQSYPNKDFDNFQVDTCAANSVYYVINGAAGCRTVTNLRGNVDQGDTVTAYFKIGGSSADTVSLVSYIAPGATFDANVASQQSIFQVVTGTFNPSTSTSGYYSLTVKVPTSFFQVDFVCGEAIDHFGPAGGNVFYSAQGRLISADNDGTVAAGILSGYVYEDLNGSGTRQSNDLGIANVTITLYDSKGVLVATQLTGSDGSYRFTGLTGDTYKLVETQPGAYLDGKEAVGTAGGNASVNDVISAIPITLKAPGFANGFEYNFAEVKAAVISGFAYVDSNDNGSKDSGETGLGNVAITLSGKNDLGQAITPVTINTNSSGAYSFTGLRPGTYVVTEAQPTGYATTGNSIGTSGGSLASPTTDVITAINLGSNANAVNYNFGELAVGTALTRSQTATIGFWHNNNGQALINSFNGGPNATGLGNWLASSFGNVYASLAGQKNSQIASYFLTLFNQSGQKTAAQFLAGALAVYATTPSLAGGSMATSYGFIVSTAGTGAATYNVGTQLVPYGGPRGVVSIIQLIQFINGKSSGGSLASGNSSLLNVINTIFSGINQTGDIV
ncbi:MAG: conserved repeat domain, partial [Planctomycetota bacterium]|nr:conserved repeat domain [Planctomycetota bacterium]